MQLLERLEGEAQDAARARSGRKRPLAKGGSNKGPEEDGYVWETSEGKKQLDMMADWWLLMCSLCETRTHHMVLQG